MRLEQTDTNNEIEVELKFTSHFKPMYAMTVHKAQGMTINEPYSIYEYKRMKKDMLYVALTRTSNKEFVNFCDIEIMKPYVGFVYRYTHNGRSYIGSTTDVKNDKKNTQQTERTSSEELSSSMGIAASYSKFLKRFGSARGRNCTTWKMNTLPNTTALTTVLIRAGTSAKKPNCPQGCIK